MVKINLQGMLQDYGNIEMSGYSVSEVYRGISHCIPEFEKRVYSLILEGYALLIKVNGEPLSKSIDDITVFSGQLENEMSISIALSLEGNSLGIIAGIGLIALAATGVGILGVGAVTWGLLGVSLIFSSIFKTPTTDNKDTPNDKRSVNFSGVNNVVGSGSCLPLAFGQVWIGSIVISAYVASDRRSLT